MTILGKKNLFYDITPIFVRKKIEKMLFLLEVMDKVVFSSLIAFYGMLTSYCDNLSTHHYHVTYHPCFDMQSLDGQTLFSRCCHVIQKKVKAIKLPYYTKEINKKKTRNCFDKDWADKLATGDKSPFISSTSSSSEAAAMVYSSHVKLLPKTVQGSAKEKRYRSPESGEREGEVKAGKCFTEKQYFFGQNTHRKFVFSMSSLVRSLLSLISSLSLKLYLNFLVYDQNIFGSSSKVFGNLQKSLESGWKSSENRQLRRH